MDETERVGAILTIMPSHARSYAVFVKQGQYECLTFTITIQFL